jgi:hypothetical protein
MASKEQVMHEMFENWSLPWQTLQRSLAEAFGAQTELGSQARLKPPSLQRTDSSSTSWLVRARGGLPQIHQAGR